MAGRMIGMRFGVDDETNRHRSEIADGRPDVARLVRVLPGIDHDDTLLGEDDPAVRLEAPSGVNVDAIGELLDLRPEILRARGTEERTGRENRQRTSRIGSHNFLPFEDGDLSASLSQLMRSAPRHAMLRNASPRPIVCKRMIRSTKMASSAERRQERRLARFLDRFAQMAQCALLITPYEDCDGRFGSFSPVVPHRR